LALVKHTLFGIDDKVGYAIKHLRMLEPPSRYCLKFSGGKDSQAIYHLAKEAGVNFRAQYDLTTVNPPELVHFIRDYYPNEILEQVMAQAQITHTSTGKETIPFLRVHYESGLWGVIFEVGNYPAKEITQSVMNMKRRK